MNKKGQALVEFIIILPITIFILLAIVDYGTISYNKNKLENIVDDVGKMYKNGESSDEISRFIDDDKVSYNVSLDDKYTTVILTRKYKCITPGLDSFFSKDIIVERKIYNES